jgi:hypothetical protein
MRLLFVFLIFASFKSHPHHVGVIEIEYNDLKKELQIAGKWFVDDLEEALEKKYKYKMDLVHSAGDVTKDSVLTNYFKTNLIFRQDTSDILIECVGAEYEKGSLWVYFVTRNFDPKISFSCRTQVLCDVLKDQSHIIHFLKNGKRESFKSDCLNPVTKFQW